MRTAVPWTAEESKLLVKLREDGLTWKEIASHFSNRTLNACQFRWKRISLNGGIDLESNSAEERDKGSSKPELHSGCAKEKKKSVSEYGTLANVGASISSITKRASSIQNNPPEAAKSSVVGKKEHSEREKSPSGSKRSSQGESHEDSPYLKRLRLAHSSGSISKLLNYNPLEDSSSDSINLIRAKDEDNREQSKAKKPGKEISAKQETPKSDEDGSASVKKGDKQEE